MKLQLRQDQKFMNNNNINNQVIKKYARRENRDIILDNSEVKFNLEDNNAIYAIYDPNIDKGVGVVFTFGNTVKFYLETKEDDKEKNQGLINDMTNFLDEVNTNLSDIITAFTSISVPISLSNVALDKLKDTLTNFFERP